MPHFRIFIIPENLVIPENEGERVTFDKAFLVVEAEGQIVFQNDLASAFLFARFNAKGYDAVSFEFDSDSFSL